LCLRGGIPLYKRNILEYTYRNERRLSVDWKKIKAEYIAGGTSYRKLAEKYKVSFSTLRKVAAKEQWTELRNKAGAKRDTKIVDSISDQEAKKAIDIIDVADKLLEKIGTLADMVGDADSIKKLTSAIKDLKDIKGIKSEADIREQEARIAKLQKEAQAEEKDSEIKITIGSDAEEYSV
jgi:tRNA G10  N-methylase Trm11